MLRYSEERLENRINITPTLLSQWSQGHRQIHRLENSMEREVCSERAWGTVSRDSDDQKRLSRGTICLSPESKGRIGVNQITKGGKEYSRQREQLLEDLSDRREQARLKNWTKFCMAGSGSCKHKWMKQASCRSGQHGRQNLTQEPFPCDFWARM